jgi:ABC-2 type transport system permease protein
VRLPQTLRPPALRGYWMTALLAAGGPISDGPLLLVDYLIRLLRFVLLLSIWRTLLAPDQAVAGVTLAAVLTYTLIAAVFADQLDVRTELGWTIWNGTVVGRYLQPIGLVGLYAAEALGAWAFRFLTFSVPLMALSPLLGVDPRPASAAHGLLFLVSLALGVTVGLAIEFVFGALLVALAENIWAIESLRNATGVLLSGALLPLALYPWSLGELFQWLPFAAMASAPLRVYTGTGDPAVLLLTQAGWAAVLWPFARWFWWRNRERMAGLGG